MYEVFALTKTRVNKRQNLTGVDKALFFSRQYNSVRSHTFQGPFTTRYGYKVVCCMVFFELDVLFVCKEIDDTINS